MIYYLAILLVAVVRSDDSLVAFDEQLSLLCPKSWPKCAKAKGVPRESLDETIPDHHVKLLKALKCMSKNRMNYLVDNDVPEIEIPHPDEVPGHLLSCRDFIQMMSGLGDANEEEFADVGCENSCESTLAFCIVEVFGTLEGKAYEHPNYNDYLSCVDNEAVKEVGCCGCRARCPAMTEQEASDKCTAQHYKGKAACKAALDPHYGICRPEGKSLCQLKVYYQGNCDNLNRRHCKMARKAFACQYDGTTVGGCG